MMAILDLICSTVIGGIFLGMLLGFNSNLVQQGTEQTVRAIAQSNATTVIDILDHELRKAGYGVSKPDSAIVSADSLKLKFKADLDNNGTIDTLTYQFDPSTASGQANHKTRILRRTVNGVTKDINIGLTRLRFYYFDANGQPLTQSPVPSPSQIRTIKISMNIESTAPYVIDTEKYVKYAAGVAWERTYKPRNVR